MANDRQIRIGDRFECFPVECRFLTHCGDDEAYVIMMIDHMSDEYTEVHDRHWPTAEECFVACVQYADQFLAMANEEGVQL